MPTSSISSFRGRLEGVGPDREDRVLALLVLAQLRAHAGEQHRELERLRDVVVGAGIQPQDDVGIGGIARQHDDRGLEAGLAHDLHGLAAIHVRKADVEQNQVKMILLGDLHTLRRRAGGQHLEFVVKDELVFQGLAKLVIIVDEQDRTGSTHEAWLPSGQFRGRSISLVALLRQVSRQRWRSRVRTDEFHRNRTWLPACAASHRARSRAATRGWLRAGPLLLPCALGRGGRSGQQARGRWGNARAARWRAVRVLYRRDRSLRPRTRLPTRSLRPDDGWCDAVGTATTIATCAIPIRPAPSSSGAATALRRDRRSRLQRRGRASAARGSAIFMHVARPTFKADGGMHRARAPRSAAAALADGAAHARLDRVIEWPRGERRHWGSNQKCAPRPGTA